MFKTSEYRPEFKWHLNTRPELKSHLKARLEFKCRAFQKLDKKFKFQMFWVFRRPEFGFPPYKVGGEIHQDSGYSI